MLTLVAKNNRCEKYSFIIIQSLFEKGTRKVPYAFFSVIVITAIA